MSDEETELRTAIASTLVLAVLASLIFGATAIVAFALHAWVLAIFTALFSIGFAVAFYKLIPKAIRDWNI